MLTWFHINSGADHNPLDPVLKATGRHVLGIWVQGFDYNCMPFYFYFFLSSTILWYRIWVAYSSGSAQNELSDRLPKAGRKEEELKPVGMSRASRRR